MKANLCEGILAFEPKPFSEYPACGLTERLIDELHGSDESRILIDMCIHAEYTSNPVTVADIAAMAKERGVRLHVHVSETRAEHEECRDRHDGLTPVRYFDSLGVFDVPVIAAHCVWVDEDDIALLAERGASVVHNPASNMKLASGFAPVPRMLDAGVSVCLGTDGMASNNNHDLFQDMYLMATISKGHGGDPSVVTPKQTLHAATRAGALAQGRDDCALVKEGFKADLCVLDVSGPSWTPLTDALTNVVYAGHGSDVVLTMCDGRTVYRDGAWPGVDVERAKREVSARTERIRAELRA